MPARECSRTACSRPAVSSLTFVYEDSTAVLGPLSRLSEPHAYDLCQEHASRMTAPRGWELLRVAGEGGVSDDLVALADAMNERPATVPASPGASTPLRSQRSPGGTRGAGATRSTDQTRTFDRTGPTGDPRRPESGEQRSARHLHVVRSPHE